MIHCDRHTQTRSAEALFPIEPGSEPLRVTAPPGTRWPDGRAVGDDPRWTLTRTLAPETLRVIWFDEHCPTPDGQRSPDAPGALGARWEFLVSGVLLDGDGRPTSRAWSWGSGGNLVGAERREQEPRGLADLPDWLRLRVHASRPWWAELPAVWV